MARAPRFDAAWQRRRRWRVLWQRWSWLAVMALILILWAMARQLGWGQGQWNAMERQFTICGEGSYVACVVDGDTIRLGQRRIRLVGFDAPEMDGACDAELALARVARAELAAWLNLGPFELEGGSEPARDQYGRELREARRGGELLADAMILRDLARRSGQDRDWCD